MKRRDEKLKASLFVLLNVVLGVLYTIACIGLLVGFVLGGRAIIDHFVKVPDDWDAFVYSALGFAALLFFTLAIPIAGTAFDKIRPKK